MSRDLTQLDKLEKWLKDNNIEYERIDIDGYRNKMLDILDPAIVPASIIEHAKEMDQHQIFVPCKEEREWDAICQWGSYGADAGLLEIMGTIVPKDHYDTVMGWLTADEVIELVKGKNAEV